MIAYKFNIFALYLRPHEIYTLGKNSVTHRVLRTSEIAHNCAVHPHLEVCQFSTRFCAQNRCCQVCTRAYTALVSVKTCLLLYVKMIFESNKSCAYSCHVPQYGRTFLWLQTTGLCPETSSKVESAIDALLLLC